MPGSLEEIPVTLDPVLIHIRLEAGPVDDDRRRRVDVVEACLPEV